ncbi:MAG: hypothetical protein HY275_06500, partial [Gemmatimonadetes bacterium]|nr:hypothetical protein [Gemmatimonadota bacterium]
RTQLAGATSSFARTRTELTLESTTLTPWAFTRGLFGRATTLFDADGSVSQLSATLFNAVSRRYRFEAGLQWVRGLSAPVVTFQMQANLPSVQALSTMQQSGGTVVGGQTFSGTASYDTRSKRVLVGNDLANGRGVGYGALDVEAFLDVNGNGVRDPSEVAVPGVRVVVGSQTVTTDRDGRALVRTLNAFVPSYLEVDTASLANPMWIVERPVVGVVVRPNSATHLEVPVRPAGGIIGRLEFADGSVGPSGAEVELVHVGSREVRRAVTYSDGSFEAFKLRPGSWEVRPTNATLLRARSRADVASVDVTTAGGDGYLETVTLTLLPTMVLPPAPKLPTLPLLAPWLPDTARRLDLPMPARPRRSALEATRTARAAASAPAAPRLAPRLAPRVPFSPDARPTAPRARSNGATPAPRFTPAPGAPRPTPRATGPRAFTPDARPSAPRIVRPPSTRPTTPDARPTAPRARATPDARPAAPRANAGPDARPTAPRVRANPDARPAAPRARVTPDARSARPGARLTPDTRPAVPRTRPSPDARPSAPRARATPDARPSAPRARATPAPQAPRGATPRRVPPRGGTTVRPED